MTANELAAHAAEARRRAYAPYSRFPVGAALLADDNSLFTACNVENASYGLSICAERAAVFSAIAAGATSFQAIAVSARGGARPCGACRQVLHEFSPEMKVYLADENGTVTSETTLDALIPCAFGPENLD